MQGRAPATQPLGAQSPGGKAVDKILFRESLTPADDKHVVAEVKTKKKRKYIVRAACKVTKPVEKGLV